MQSAAMTTPHCPQAVYIKDRNSGKFFQYKPETTYEVVIENKQSGLATQQWLLTESGVPGYIYVESKYDGNVITAGDNAKDPLIVSPKKSGLPTDQLWILRAPGSGTNPNFVMMSAKTGLVMDIKGGSKDAGTPVIVYSRTNNANQQFSFLN